MDAGRVIALDEAHKVSASNGIGVSLTNSRQYMNASEEAMTLTNTLLSVIRLQRHLGARVIISTQEPTVSPKLLDLCSMTIVHRFTSPDWLSSLKNHLAAVATTKSENTGDVTAQVDHKLNAAQRIFNKIVQLKVGEALLFAPTAMVGTNKCGLDTTKLGTGFLEIRVRNRLTLDGGKSVMAI
jgi:hypothetical protein